MDSLRIFNSESKSKIGSREFLNYRESRSTHFSESTILGFLNDYLQSLTSEYFNKKDKCGADYLREYVKQRSSNFESMNYEVKSFLYDGEYEPYDIAHHYLLGYYKADRTHTDSYIEMADEFKAKHKKEFFSYLKVDEKYYQIRDAKDCFSLINKKIESLSDRAVNNILKFYNCLIKKREVPKDITILYILLDRLEINFIPAEDNNYKGFNNINFVSKKSRTTQEINFAKEVFKKYIYKNIDRVDPEETIVNKTMKGIGRKMQSENDKKPRIISRVDESKYKKEKKHVYSNDTKGFEKREFKTRSQN